MEQSAQGGRNQLEISQGVEIVCTQCYMTGLAKAELTAERFNISNIVHQALDEVEGSVVNFTDAVFDYIGDAIDEVAHQVGEQVSDAFHGDFHDVDAIEMPTLDYDFSNFSVPALPEIDLKFGFDSLEIYAMLDTTLSLGSTYTYNLYTSKSVMGAGISGDLFLGIVFTLDLILTADAEIDISSGFHIKMDDGLSVDIPLFGNEASGIDL